MTKHAYKLTEAMTVAEVRAESEALFRSIGDGAIATDEFGRITRINPTALAILKLKPEEALGQWFPRTVTVMRPDGTPIPLIERPIVKMFLTGKSIIEKALYRAKDNRVVPVSITVSPIILGGRPVGAIEVFRDITLENEVDRMKSEFISLASHQLRTPLSTIQTYAHMLSEGYMGRLAAEQTSALRTIISATDNMNELIATLLNIARIESGSIAVNRKLYDIVQLTTDVLKQLRLNADSKGVALTFQPPKQPILFETDSLIIKEVLTNLVGNAIKYTPSGGDVTVRIRNNPKNMLFTVQDTGIGIPHAVHEKVFAKFFRAPNALRQETSGTGLGLYVVRGLVLILHGKIWFRSEEGEGSTFYVSLPKDNDDSASAPV
jgi:PAS domain S-box-containing protein